MFLDHLCGGCSKIFQRIAALVLGILENACGG